MSFRCRLVSVVLFVPSPLFVSIDVATPMVHALGSIELRTRCLAPSDTSYVSSRRESSFLTKKATLHIGFVPLVALTSGPDMVISPIPSPHPQLCRPDIGVLTWHAYTHGARGRPRTTCAHGDRTRMLSVTNLTYVHPRSSARRTAVILIFPRTIFRTKILSVFTGIGF